MTWEEIDKELTDVSNYLKTWIELMSTGDFTGLRKYNLPTFNDYKIGKFGKPQYREAKRLGSDGYVSAIHTHGIDGSDTIGMIGYRYYGTWLGTKYFMPDNPNGDYTIADMDEQYVNGVLKNIGKK